jgi:YbbR domain-containing protein
MMRVIRHLRNNLGTALLSLLLAFVIWIWATLEADPFTNKLVANVPVTPLNQPDDTVLYNADQVSDQVDVDARGPGSVVEKVDSSDFEAVMDLSVLQPGTEEPVTVQVTSTNEALRVLAVDPEKQVVLLEAVKTLTVPVTIEVQGEVAPGYRSLPPVIIPDEVGCKMLS